MRLVKDAKRAWRFYSVQAMGVAAAIQGAWVALPPDMLASIPEWAVQAVTGVVLVSGVVGRLVDQGGDDGTD